MQAEYQMLTAANYITVNHLTEVLGGVRPGQIVLQHFGGTL